jgi:hypothetical protein
MSAVLEGLRLTGREEKARDIAQRWNALLVTLKAEDTAEYRRCFPGRLLRRIAEITKTGVEEIGCLSANESTMPSVGGLLNDAWHRFWQDPRGVCGMGESGCERAGGVVFRGVVRCVESSLFKLLVFTAELRIMGSSLLS